MFSIFRSGKWVASIVFGNITCGEKRYYNCIPIRREIRFPGNPIDQFITLNISKYLVIPN